MSIDLESTVAIDVHAHVQISADGHHALPPHLMHAHGEYFKAGDHVVPTVDDVAGYYRARNMAAVVFTVDAETETGHPPVPNEEVAQGCARHPDTLIPFASVDPRKGARAVREARRMITEFGVRGFKFHPNLQAFTPNSREFYPLYEAIEEGGAVALFHSGQSGIGAGLPGGGGFRLKYSNPLYIDDIAADFPDLAIVLAHPSFPWQDEALAVATHKPRVYIDLSGWSPKYFPPQLVRYANTMLREKVLFGSDFPVLTPDRWLADFAKIEIKDEVRPLILKDNAARLFKLHTREAVAQA